MQLIKLHTTIPTHSQLHQAGITSTYSFQSKYLKVHATDQTALNYTNPQPTTPSYTYLLWFTFKYINYFPESTLVLAVLSYINPHSTMPIYTQLHRSTLNNTGTILNNTYLYWTSIYKLFSALLTHTQLHLTATVSYLLLMVIDVFSLFVLFRFCFPISDHVMITQRTRFIWNVVLCTCI